MYTPIQTRIKINVCIILSGIECQIDCVENAARIFLIDVPQLQISLVFGKNYVWQELWNENQA